MKKISQREAWQLRKRVIELEQLEARRRSRYTSDYPGGVHMGTIEQDANWFRGRLEASRMLGHAIVVTVHQKELRFYAVK